MCVENNKQIVRRYIEEVVNTGNVELIDNFISEDYVEIYDGKRYLLGIVGAKEHIKGVRQTYNNLHIEIDLQIGENDYVATSITATGIHTGKWMDIKPTGKPVLFTGVNVDKVINGKIVEHGGAANLFTTLLDIGAIKIIKEEFSEGN